MIVLVDDRMKIVCRWCFAHRPSPIKCAKEIKIKFWFIHWICYNSSIINGTNDNLICFHFLLKIFSITGSIEMETCLFSYFNGFHSPHWYHIHCLPLMIHEMCAWHGSKLSNSNIIPLWDTTKGYQRHTAHKRTHTFSHWKQIGK